MATKKERNKAPLPASSAGLLTFFDEDTPGFTVGPEEVIGIGVALVVGSLLLLAFLR